jgi:hypothetical protein
LAAAVWAAALAAVGCGSSRTVPVRGQVVWDDGTPAGDLVGYTVEATVPGSAVSARGDIVADGRFSLSTFVEGDGAEPGAHQVSVAPIPRGETDPPPKTKLPARYADARKSGLTLTVERGKSNDVTLTVSRK